MTSKNEDRSPEPYVDLASFDRTRYQPGRGFGVRLLWYFVSLVVFEGGWVPVSRPKSWLLRLFGARIGRGVVIKPHVRIKYPWRLSVGDHCWIGQEAWIDNLADVQLGDHVCLSQRVYLCTGSHDYRRQSFDLITATIQVGSGAWIGAASLVLGGIEVGPNAIVAAGSVVTRNVAEATIVAGNPARPRPHPRPSPAEGQASSARADLPSQKSP